MYVFIYFRTLVYIQSMQLSNGTHPILPSKKANNTKSSSTAHNPGIHRNSGLTEVFASTQRATPPTMTPRRHAMSPLADVDPTLRRRDVFLTLIGCHWRVA